MAMLVLSIGHGQVEGGLIAAVVALLAALVYRRKLPILAPGPGVAFLGSGSPRIHRPGNGS